MKKKFAKKSIFALLMLLIPFLVTIGMAIWIITTDHVITPSYDSTHTLARYFDENNVTTYNSKQQHPLIKSSLEDIDEDNLYNSVTWYYKKYNGDTLPVGAYTLGYPTDAGKYKVKILPNYENNEVSESENQSKALYVNFIINKASLTLEGDVNPIYPSGYDYFTNVEGQADTYVSNVNNITFTGTLKHVVDETTTLTFTQENGTFKFASSSLNVGTYSYNVTYTLNDNYEVYNATSTITTYATVKFIEDVNDTTISTCIVQSGNTVSNVPVIPTYPHYNFNAYKVNDSVWDTSSTITNNLTVTMHYVPIEYTVTINPNGGTLSDSNWTLAADGTYQRKFTVETAGFKLPTTLLKDGLSVSGYTGEGYSNILDITITGDLIKDCSFTANYKVKFYIKANDGSKKYDGSAYTPTYTLYKSSDNTVLSDTTGITVTHENLGDLTTANESGYNVRFFISVAADSDYLYDETNPNNDPSSKIIITRIKVNFDQDFYSISYSNTTTYEVLKTNLKESQIKLVDADDKTDLSVGYSITGITDGYYYYGNSTGIEKMTDKLVGSTYKIDVELDDTTNYVLNDTAYCKYKTVISGTSTSTYYTIEEAINTSSISTISFAGDSSNASSYVMTSFTSLTECYNDTTTYTISGKTLIVPYDANNNSYQEDQNATSGNVYSSLTIPSNIILDIKNSSTLTIASLIGFNMSISTTLALNRGVLVNNGTINISSSTLKAYGYLKGKGRVNIDGSSTAYDSMSIYDWPGGTAASSMCNNVFPSNAWSFHNISCETKIMSNARYYGNVYIVAGGVNLFETILVIGKTSDSNCLFKPTAQSNSNYLIKKATKSITNSKDTNLDIITGSNQKIGQKDIIDVYGSYQDSSLYLSKNYIVIKVVLETSTTKPLPVGYMDITIKQNSSFTISASDYLFYPGTKLVIEKGANVTISENCDIVFGTKEQFNKILTGNRAFCKNGYLVDNYESYCEVNGTLTVNGNIAGKYTTSDSSAKLIINGNTTGSFIALNSVTESEGYFKTGTLYANGPTKTASEDKISYLSKGEYLSSGTAWYSTQATIYFDANGGTLTGVSSKGPYSTGATGYTITASDMSVSNPTRDYYTFGGWYLEPECITTTVGNAIFGNTTVYAKWIPIEYTINYIDEYYEGFASGNSSTHSNQTTFTVETNSILTSATNNNYVFAGYFTDIDCTNNITSLVGSDLVSLLGSSNYIDIYLSWYPEGTTKYTITYVNDNSDFIGITELDYVIVNDNWSDYSLLKLDGKNNDKEYSKYFAGWQKEDGTITNSLSSNLFAGGSYECTLTAVWADKNKFNISIMTYTTDSSTPDSTAPLTWYLVPDATIPSLANKLPSGYAYIYNISSGSINKENIKLSEQISTTGFASETTITLKLYKIFTLSFSVTGSYVSSASVSVNGYVDTDKQFINSTKSYTDSEIYVTCLSKFTVTATAQTRSLGRYRPIQIVVGSDITANNGGFLGAATETVTTKEYSVGADISIVVENR